MLRKQNQRNRGRSSIRGRGTTKPRGQQHQHEADSSSSRPPQRGDFNRGRFAPRGRVRGRDIRCFHTQLEFGEGFSLPPKSPGIVYGELEKYV